MEQHLHSPADCHRYQIFQPLPFSHSRYLKIKLNQVRYRFRTNSPYISGDSIASTTDYVAYGPFKNRKLNLRKVERAKSIFVYGDMLTRFLVESDGYLNASTLVTGNSDANFVEPIALPESIKLWLCQNNGMPEKEGVLTLPIGIENIKLGRTGIPHFYKKHESNVIVDKVLIPPMSNTNPIRAQVILKALTMPDLFDVRTQLLNEVEYFALSRKFKFIFSCEGNGFENHRIWETLYQGSFPVVLKTPWSWSLRYLQLPILYVPNLEAITRGELDKFAKLHSNFRPESAPALWTPYWKTLIQSTYIES